MSEKIAKIVKKKVSPGKPLSGPDDGKEQNQEFTQILTFELNGELYGISVTYVKEVLEYDRITKVPNVPLFIRGVINLRGDVIPVIDLKARFYGKRCTLTKKTCIVIIEQKDMDEISTTGIMIDAVNAVLDIPASEIKPTPGFGAKIRSDFIKGIINENIQDRFILLLNISKILDFEELTAFGEKDAAEVAIT